jgi:hypothetical protein
MSTVGHAARQRHRPLDERLQRSVSDDFIGERRAPSVPTVSCRLRPGQSRSVRPWIHEAARRVIITRGQGENVAEGMQR